MSETEQTPVRARYADNWAMELLCRLAAPTVFASVDVEGLAAEIGRHWLTEPSHAYGDARRVTRSCNCGRTLEPQFFEWRHSQEMTQHEAEAIVAWLGGGV